MTYDVKGKGKHNIKDPSGIPTPTELCSQIWFCSSDYRGKRWKVKWDREEERLECLITPETVSYTHLDVYKRQHLHTTTY